MSLGNRGGFMKVKGVRKLIMFVVIVAAGCFALYLDKLTPEFVQFMTWAAGIAFTANVVGDHALKGKKPKLEGEST